MIFYSGLNDPSHRVGAPVLMVEHIGNGVLDYVLFLERIKLTNLTSEYYSSLCTYCRQGWQGNRVVL